VDVVYSKLEKAYQKSAITEQDEKWKPENAMRKRIFTVLRWRECCGNFCGKAWAGKASGKTTRKDRYNAEAQSSQRRESRRRDPSTPRPDAPDCGAKEKIGPLRSG